MNRALEFLNETQFYNENSLLAWVIALIVLIVSLIILRLLKQIVLNRIRVFTEKTKTEWDDLVIRLVEQTRFFFLFFISLFFASQVLNLRDGHSSLINTLVKLALIVQAAFWGSEAINFWIQRYKREDRAHDAARVTTMTALGYFVKVTLWVLLTLTALHSMGVPITTFVAWTTVGGLALTFAVQNILKDLFASFSIVLDKPFVLGDFLIVGDLMGTVEHIGLKTTRIRSLSGEQLVFCNTDLLESRIRNYKRMFERRVVFSLGVVYQTPHEKLAAIPSMIREIIETREQVRFDRAHFKEYGDFSLNMEIVYYVLVPDYNVYMDIQQAINLDIYRKFQEEGIEFAYPTQTLFMAKEGA